MKASQIQAFSIFKRNIAGLIIPVVMAILYIVIIGIFIILSSIWGMDPLANFIILFASINLTVFFYAIAAFYKQPSHIAILEDGIVIIGEKGKNQKEFPADEVEIKIYKEIIQDHKILVILLMGLLPGMLFYLSLGINKLIFSHQGKDYTLCYIGERNIRKLFKTLTSSSVLNDYELQWQQRIQRWEDNAPVRKKICKFSAIAFGIILVLIAAGFLGAYYIPKIDLNYAGGLGTEDSPYRIETGEELQYFRDQVNSGKYEGIYFTLSADINLEGKEWTPIGINSDNSFRGCFDGKGYSISNYQINGSIRFAGLFGINKGKIENLGTENFLLNVTAFPDNEYLFWDVTAGGLSAYNNGIIENCYAINGEIWANDGIAHAGGLVGENTKEIINCYAFCDINVKSTRGTVVAGGLVGWNLGNGISNNCFAAGDVSASGFNEENSRAAGFSADRFGGNNSYRFEGQVISRTYGIHITNEPSSLSGNICTLENLNDKMFYTDMLGWSEETWDFSGLDFENGKLPVLRKND